MYKIEITEEIKRAFQEIQQARPDFELEKFVVGEKDTEQQAYAQCVLELQIKYNNIRRGILNRKKLEIQVEKLKEKNDEISDIKADLKRIDIEEQDYAMLGAIREFEALKRIFESFPKKYTRQELNDAQPEYWKKRLTRQANLDLLAKGRVGVGNLDALRQIGLSTVPELDHIRETEQKYLENGNVKMLIAVPTEKKAVNGLACLEGLIMPSGVQVKYYNCWGRTVADAYNDIAMQFLNDNADILLTVEDDTFPEPEAILKLYERIKDGFDAIGAWYPKRNKAKEGAHIILGEDGNRTFLDADGKIHEVYTLAMGCTMYTKNCFLKTDFPFFATTANLSQDSFFSQKLRDAGVKLYCDTAIKCKHIDRETGEVFE